MVQIQIQVDDEELDKRIEIYQAENRLDNKPQAVVKILKEYFEKEEKWKEKNIKLK